MATKKTSLFGVPTKDVKPEKLPTIGQYIKSTRPDEIQLKGLVELVWFPGKFKNFTLQTEFCRAIITPNHLLYSGLRLYFADIPELPCEMYLEITDIKQQSYMLTEGREHVGYWETIGDSGVRWVDG